ncbi:short-chain dehydrogenase [Mycolicibacterium madagascariense]|uniref:Short-chain dehydrogenase n=1 Tax=Mycolicibacterium madagascariense TaxID=212765 RepID=A0A7I7XNP8_9MYCO|nr:SDR family NAD(P)-dependent oxidoreductase [Mycolicibacterium madagascariense]MCV7012674.1 SDR family NAD(P)-dependent oxidoreductase [Mycolicibacterium madagascariense]BBZ30830.1 short-chain dehydrogenase [Mycolicibacterium madagascariense]
MARIFITGSTDGLGSMAARLLADGGHEVMLHARTAERADEARAALPANDGVAIGDVSSLEEMRSVAEQAADSGPFDAVIHNVGLGFQATERISTVDGLAQTFAVNVLAPYVITASMPQPSRLIYLSSKLHRRGEFDLDDPQWTRRPWDGNQAYADSKLLDVMLAFGIARRWPDVLVNSVEPGWVPTKLGGADASDDLEAGPVTQAWLAVSNDPAATVTGQHFFHQELADVHPEVRSVEKQDALLDYCARLADVKLA